MPKKMSRQIVLSERNDQQQYETWAATIVTKKGPNILTQEHAYRNLWGGNLQKTWAVFDGID